MIAARNLALAAEMPNTGNHSDWLIGGLATGRTSSKARERWRRTRQKPRKACQISDDINVDKA